MPKAKELHDMEDTDLLEALRTARAELFGLRFRHATGELEDTARLRVAKRDVARALTVARTRGIDVTNA
jgi:large subunit ribosomal protein L29